jgi:hypothetical protein
MELIGLPNHFKPVAVAGVAAILNKSLCLPSRANSMQLFWARERLG